MIYTIENIKDGSYITSAGSYEEALEIQEMLWTVQGIDSCIIERSL